MSDTPHEPDDCQKLLDNGWTIVLYKNRMGSISAVATKDHDIGPTAARRAKENEETDDFTPSQALYRLTEKVFGNIA